MIFAFDARKDFFDVIETADQARAQIETFRFERLSRGTLRLERIEPGAEDVVDQLLERDVAFFLFPLEPRGHIIVKSQGRAHIMMICS